MTKKKMRFNIIDAVILIIVAAAIALLGYIFIFSDDSEAPKDIHTVEYVLVVERVNKDLYDNDPIKNGAVVYDAEKKTVLGYVSDEPETPNTFDPGYNPELQKEVYAPRTDLIDVYVTIRCTAEKNEWGYTVSDVSMPVGATTKLIIGNMFATATTIEMNVLD